MSLFEMSISGGILILAVTVIRALTLNRLPKRTFLALWLLAVLRLLVPFSVPSPVSVYTLAEPVEITEMPQMTAPVYISVDVGQTRGVQIPIRQIVWGTGTALCAVFFMASYLHCRRRFRESLPVEEPAAAEWLAGCRLRRRVEIRQCAQVSAPLTYGVLRPVILLPETADWGERMAYVLEHELVHIRRFDAAWKLLLTAAVCVHWWNPLVWVMYALANRDIELSCDEAVVRRFGLGKRSVYAMTLIGMEESRSALPPLASSFSRNAIEERITAIMKMKKTSVIAILLAAVLVCGVSVGFATSAEERPEDLRKYLTALGNFSGEESRKLLSLWFDGYEDMTIADYQEKMWTIGDNQEDMELIEKFAADDGLMVFSFHNEKESQANRAFMDYFYHIYSPLTSESWQNRSFSNAAGGTLLEYNYRIGVLDAERARVGEYEKLQKAVKEAMSALSAEGSDLERGIAALEERLSTDRLQVDITDFSFRPEEPDAGLQAAFSGSVSQDWAEELAPYLRFGLTYEFNDPDDDGNGLMMRYQGREVRGIVDEQKGTWLTEHAGNGFSADAIELYTVYENGKLAGLRPATAEEQAAWDREREHTSAVADIHSNFSGSLLEPREFPNATEEDYALFLELMDGSADSKLSDFNKRLLDWGNEHPEAYDRIMCDVCMDDYAVELSDADKQFAALTCRLSGTENGMYVRSLYTGRPEEDPGFSEDLPEWMTVESGITVAWCSLYYQCSYHIADKSAVTVRERDAVISGFRQGVQEFWTKTSMDSLLSMTEGQAVDRLNSIAAEYSTDSIQVVPMTLYGVHFEAIDERGHD